MHENPIEQRLHAIGMIPRTLSTKTGISTGAVSDILSAKQPLTPKNADRMAPVVGVSGLTLLVGNAAWRRLEGVTLTGNERALLDLVGDVTGLEPAALAHLAHLPAAGLTLNEAVKVLRNAELNAIPDPPAIVLKGASDYEKSVKTNAAGSPVPPDIVLQNQTVEDAQARFRQKIFGGDK